ncbi:MAG: 23S rRNA (uracil-C(5))-methyltransferase RlmCD [Eubacteriales bacterium SKADARSKE-1]|nr:23S rRNA (uracil-C(5))-methyltransferase RlmCD [Eubacteriales bacterium SKADARSKE-1]
MNIKKNDILKLEIVDLTSDGNGVGKLNGIPIFVPNIAVGDKLLARILKVKSNHAYGKIEELLSSSPHRIEVDCKNYLQCGGCAFRHITYQAELSAKEQRVKDAIRRIGGFSDLKISPILGAKDADKYRNKAQIPIGKNEREEYILGFYAKHSHRIIDSARCNLHPDIFATIINIFKKWASISKPSVYNEKTHTGLLRHLYLRIAKGTGEIMVCIVVNGENIPQGSLLVDMLKSSVSDIKSIVVNTNTDKTNVIMGKKSTILYGQDYITDILCNLKFNISPNSFYQVNHDQAEVLYNLVKQYANLKGNETLLDLYCGTGTIGLTMANDCKKVIGVEIIEDAIKDAKNNAELNKISNTEFICADAKEAVLKFSSKNEFPDVVILDPPRKGCDLDTINSVVDMGPKRIVYVSCDPATLARDLKIFSQKGYFPKELTPVDMFPRTTHVECVALMSQVKG